MMGTRVNATYCTIAVAICLLLVWLALGVLLPCNAGALDAWAVSDRYGNGEIRDSSESEASITERLPARGHHFLEAVGVDAEAFKLYAKWIVGAPIIVMTLLILMLLRAPKRKGESLPEGKSEPAASETDEFEPPEPDVVSSIELEAFQPAPRTKTKSARPAVKMSDKQQVLRFFLTLFKNQQGAESDAPVQLVRVETRNTLPDETYEMRVMFKDEWITRRMSIGLLGQGGGSRSKCFYVIYDSHLVIKIPPVPMSSFKAYRQQIATEGHIVSRLAPRPCIVPRVSVILTAFHSFPQSVHNTEEILETKYVRQLQDNPEFQEHLKIGDSFAFFMDLAKHYFLSTVLEEMHRGKDRLIDEARQHPELLWDQHAFVCRYGDDAGAVCHELQEAYYRCESSLRQLAERGGASKAMSTYHLKQWFLTHMAGEIVRREEYDLPSHILEKINQELEEVVKNNRSAVGQYRQHLREYVRKTRFSQYRRQFEGLATNMLDLLAWIREKGLAMRDLKPENLFVAGNPDDYPVFLNTPEKFTLGLIDVETAVPIDAEDPILIPQPQLAGTPLFATPAHLMSNSILMNVYEDPAEILHLQDWFATIGIIYKTISGENLFATTAHVFPEILSRLKLIDPAGPEMQREMAQIQRLFWNSAVAEFQENTTKHKNIFSLVEVTVPEILVSEILDELNRELDEIEQSVAQAVSDQSFFTSDDKKRYLKTASAVKLAQMMKKVTNEMENGDGLAQGQILLYFELLQKLKFRQEEKQQAADTVSAPKPTINAYQLLAVMFQRVFNAMYLADWPTLAPKLYGSSSFLATDVTTYQATL